MKPVLFVLALLPFALGHYTFPHLIVNGTVSAEWEYIRMTENHWSNGPVTDVSSSAIRCYEIDSNAAGAAGTATVSAGSTVGFKANDAIYHPGTYAAYLSAANPAANSNSAGTGETWFKIWQWIPTYSPGTGFTFPSDSVDSVNFTIPKSTPSGQYLLRIEHIALHGASTVGGAQFYLSCAQLNIVNGGNGSPSPLVSFPGAYSANDPGIVLNIYSPPAGYSGYIPPGPTVWSG